jgi:Type IV secretion-system coupling protein DNA-binding domain
MEHILRNALLILADQPSATLGDILRLLHEPLFRRQTLAHVASPQVQNFWINEYEQYPWRLRTEATAPIENKVGAFLTHPILNHIFRQPRSSVPIRQVMDEGRILLVNLAKGRLGEDAAALFGALLVSHLGLAGLARADQPEASRRPFFVYLDEFHTFTTLGLATMLSELRKYGVGMILTHQYLGQLDTTVCEAVLGNVGTIAAFRVGLADAEILAQEFYPVFSAADLASLPNHRIYLRLMIDGAVSQPFSAETVTAAELSTSIGGGHPSQRTKSRMLEVPPDHTAL